MDGRNAPHKDPGGFLEGALLNKDLTAAHDKFMADVEVRALKLGEHTVWELVPCP